MQYWRDPEQTWCVPASAVIENSVKHLLSSLYLTFAVWLQLSHNLA